MPLSQATRPNVDDLFRIIRKQLTGMSEADYAPLVHRFEQSRLTTDGYTGPNPQPILNAVTNRIRAHGTPVTFDTATVLARYPDRTMDDGQVARVWGYFDGLTGTVLIRTDITVRGQLLTLAHEGGHALTRDRDHLSLGFGDLLLRMSYGLTSDYILDEVIAETTAYLVGAATGAGLDPVVHAGYITGYLYKLQEVTDDVSDVLKNAALSAQRAAGIMLGRGAA